MKTWLGTFLVISLAGIIPLHAELTDVRISVNKQSGKTEKGEVGDAGSRAADTTLVTYEIKLEDAILKDLNDLTVDYIIFVERQKLGTKKETDILQRLTDTQTVATLTKLAPQTLTTKEIKLFKSNLVGNFIYSNGARVKAEDSIKGIWVRVSQGGKLIAEYINPSTIKKQGWDKK